MKKVTLFVDERVTGDPASILMLLAENRKISARGTPNEEVYAALVESCLNAKVEVVRDEN